jgi:hypothetical protein
MATGDQSDMLARLKSVLPRWFTDSSSVLFAVLQGFAWVLAFVYSLLMYAKLQTRIKTATDGHLDMIAADFFGTALLRSQNQSDASFRARIIANLMRERGTRNSISKVLQDLTARTPVIIEPWRPADTGAYNCPNSGYGTAGSYASLDLPFQAFVKAYRPIASGVPYTGCYGLALYPGSTYGGAGGYGVASRLQYASIDMVQGQVQDSDIYAAIESVRPVGATLWVNISN